MKVATVRTPACSRVDLSPLALNHVRDLAFVEGYAEPVLAVLCEPLQTWSGRLAFLANTCTLAALQLSSRKPTVWTGGSNSGPHI